MINIINEKDCCGCAACASACPVNCIKMVEGSLGHVFPIVNKDICIGCNKCEKVCPIINFNCNESKKELYAAYALDKDIRFKGSSGGMFGVIANRLIDQGFSVYGASFDEDLKLKCTCANSKKELEKLYKSKYLQSDMSKKYREIKDKLTKGEKVLFVSTPCQVSALKNFLNKSYDNLVLVDFICHGVPSQKFFDQCKEYDEGINNYKIKDFQFRTKIKNGSTPHYFKETIVKNNCESEKVKLYFESSFYLAFQRYINLRESCYKCKFSSEKRSSDITISDFHDIDNYRKGINRFDGVSLLMINTDTGKKILNLICNDISIDKMDFKTLKKDKVIFTGGTERPKQRDEFVNDYNNLAFDSFAKKWMNKKLYWKQSLYYNLPKCFRNILKKVWRV